MAKPKASLARPTAIVPAGRADAPVHLTKSERQVFEQALRLGEDLADEVESKVSAYGRWLLEAVFDDNAASALDGKSTNPVWLELSRRAGGPTLPLSRRMLYVALQLAARDKRISDNSWRRLDAGRKEILLPLDDDRRLREAAHHVSSFNLTQAKTRVYVATLLAEKGRTKQVRLSPKTLSTKLRKLRESLDGAGVLRKVREMTSTLELRERAKMAAEVEKLRTVLQGIAKELVGPLHHGSRRK